MRILHLISSLQRGGAERILLTLIDGLAARGHQQAIIVIHDGPLRQELPASVPCYLLQAYGSYVNPLFWIRCIRFIRSYRPDCMHTSLWASNAIGRILGALLKVPTIGSVHALPSHEGLVRNQIDQLLNSSIPPYRTIAASATIAAGMIDTGRYSNDMLIVIPNGVPIEQQSSTLCKDRTTPYQKKAGSYIIGAVGRLVPCKQFDRLIAAYAQFQKEYTATELWIIGSGPEEARLRACITAYGVDATVRLITNQNARDVYREFDCCILPSRDEGLGIVLLEAMAAGIPVIATRNRWNRTGHEIITDGSNGLLIDADSIDSWIAALRRYRNSTSLRAACSAHGYKTVIERFSAERMVQEYEQIFMQTKAAQERSS